MDKKEKYKEIWSYILKEFCPLVQRHSLEGTGLIAFLPVFSDNWRPLSKLLNPPWNLTIEEAKTLYTNILNTLRYKMAIKFPENAPSPEDEVFAPRNKKFFFRGEESDRKRHIFSFISKSHNNARLDLIKKVYKTIFKSDPKKEICRELLGEIWEDLSSNYMENGLERYIQPKIGITYQLDYRCWKIVMVGENSAYYRCNRCGHITINNLKSICPTYNLSLIHI